MTNIRQVGFTTNNRHVEFKMTHDPSFISDASLFHYLERQCLPEPEVVHLMSRVLQPGDTAIDVGANIGFFTLLMSRLVGDVGKVVSFEPGVNNLEKLRTNIKLNDISNVDQLGFAVWNSTHPMTLHLAVDSGSNSLQRHDLSLSSVAVDVVSLSDYQYPKKPALLKVDAEGAEYEIFEGAHILLDGGVTNHHTGIPYVVCELNHKALARFDHAREDVVDLMHDYGYSLYALRLDGGFPLYVPPGVKIKSDTEALNVLFSTSESVVKAWPEIVM